MPKSKTQIYEEIIDDFRYVLDEVRQDYRELLIAHIEGQFESLTDEEAFDFWSWTARTIGAEVEAMVDAYNTIGRRVKPIVHHGRMS